MSHGAAQQEPRREPLGESVVDEALWDSDEAARSAAQRELAPELQRQGVTRLGGIALAGAVTMAGYLALVMLLAPRDQEPWQAIYPTIIGVSSGVIAASIVLFSLTRLRALRPAHVLDLGYAYLFVVCFLLGVLRHAAAWPPSEPFRQWSLVTAPIMAFGALVPAHPRKALATALAAAAMDPLAFYVLRTHAADTASRETALLLTSPFLGALLAYAASRVIFRLSEGIVKAREVGGYRLVERLGVGGMAEVWRADHRLLARPAAVKLIRPAVLRAHGPDGSRRLVRLFAREARTTASLSSPHTIQLFDFGITRDGAFYYVMELLEGIDLQTLVERFGPQPADRVAHLLHQTCHSLDEAHSRRFVHRDVKPANIFTCHVGNDYDFVKVLDFGLVLDRHPTAEELDDERRLVGTPAVMAPEMVRFQAPVDARADLYAVGCVAYWLLTGTRVFEAATRNDMLVMHAHQRPVPPSKRLGQAVHGGLEEIVMRCLEKNPNRRPQTARELMDLLEGLAFAPPWSRERARLWWLKHDPIAPSEAGQGTEPGRDQAAELPA